MWSIPLSERYGRVHKRTYSCRSTAVCTCTHRRCCCATLTSFVQNCRLCRMATLRPGLQQEYDRWWPILSAGGSQCYWLLAASFWGRQEAVLVLPGGVPGGQFCESCIFERSYLTAFTYHIRYFWQVPASAVWHCVYLCVHQILVAQVMPASPGMLLNFYTKLTLWFHTILTHRHFGVPCATFVSRALASKYINEHHTFVRTQLFCVYILCANFHMKTRTQKSWCTLDSKFGISHIRKQYRCSSRIATVFQILGKSTTWYR